MSVTWVVYQTTLHGKVTEMNAVCDDKEWETLQQLQPGRHTLILAGIESEADAERIARVRTLGDEPIKPRSRQ
jgi:hypothetical protein